MIEEVLKTALLGALAGGCLGLALTPVYMAFDRIIVWADDHLGARRFRLARDLAARVRGVPDEWQWELGRLRHPPSGTCIRVSAANGQVWEVETPGGRWDPNMFERRILFGATQWRARRQLARNLAAGHPGAALAARG